MTNERDADLSRARSGLAWFLSIVVIVTGTIQIYLISLGGPIEEHGAWAFAMMWTPGLASILVRLARREGFDDVSFRLAPVPGAAREWWIAWLAPVGVGLLAYGCGWGLGLAEWRASPGLSQTFHVQSRELVLLLALSIQLLLGTPLAALSAFGEELGWRGYMLTRLIRAGLPSPVLLSGVIWGLWHVPLILSGQYAAGPMRWLSAACFLISVTAGGLIAGRVRLLSGSVWPAVVFHASWNAVIQGAFNTATQGYGTSNTQGVWLGEAGVLTSLAVAGVAVFAARPIGAQV